MCLHVCCCQKNKKKHESVMYQYETSNPSLTAKCASFLCSTRIKPERVRQAVQPDERVQLTSGWRSRRRQQPARCHASCPPLTRTPAPAWLTIQGCLKEIYLLLHLCCMLEIVHSCREGLYPFMLEKTIYLNTDYCYKIQYYLMYGSARIRACLLF